MTHTQASKQTITGRGGHPPLPQQLMAVLAVGCAPVMGPLAPTMGSGIGVVLHELHVGIHHFPHQLLQREREQMRVPAQGVKGQHIRSTSEHDDPLPSPGPLAAGQGGDRALLGSSRSGPGPGVCQCAAVHQGCPLLPWWLLSSKHEPRQGHRKWDFLVCPGRTEDQHNSSPCCQSPSQWIVFRGQEHPAGTTHTRKATHIERDSRLPVQFLSGFGTVPLKKIL